MRFGLVDIGRERTYWFATKNAAEGEADDPAGRKAEILRRFAGWHEPIATVAEAADETAILRNDVYYLDPPPVLTWSKKSSMKERAVSMGSWGAGGWLPGG
jgi:hypothetical protein